MIDARRTLDPASGLTVASSVVRPQPPERPLWEVLADLGGPREDGFSLHLVGAYGASPADALVRGAGEAVERFALRGEGDVLAPGLGRTDAATAPQADAPDLDAWWPAGVTPVAMVPATDAVSGATVVVPRALVDDRPADEPGVDHGPSGAAAGGDLEHAVRGALHEVVERDAILCAWDAALAPRRLDLDAAAGRLDRRAARRLGALRTAAAALAFEVHAAVIPTALPDRPVVLAALRHPDGTVAGIGAKLADDAGRAVVGAVQEAFQLRQVLDACAERLAPRGPERIDDDVARARWLTSDDGRATLRRWVAAWTAGPAAPLPDPAPLTLAATVAHVAADGGRPLVCDLTPRLPEPVRAMGWHAARVLVPGLQPLRIDERHAGRTMTDRITTTHERTGLPHDAGISAAGPRPHPLV